MSWIRKWHRIGITLARRLATLLIFGIYDRRRAGAAAAVGALSPEREPPDHPQDAVMPVRVPGTPPPPGSIVIREGNRRPAADVMEEAEDDKDERFEAGHWDGKYQLSVFAGLPQPGEDLDMLPSRLFSPYRTVKFFRSATVEVLAEAGFTLVASPPDPYHYDVILGTKLTPEVVQAFDDCFAEARRNPLWQRKK